LPGASKKPKIRPKLSGNIINIILLIQNLHTVHLNGRFMVARYILKLIGINAVLLWATVAAADVRHGTYFALIYFPDYAAVAIDSRVTSDGNYSDQMCKLFPLSERVVFFSAGVYDGKNPAGTIIFSPHATAGEVFGRSSSHSLSDISEQWAHNMVERIELFSVSNREIVEHYEDGFITRGVFAGESGNEGVVAYQSTIRRSDNIETVGPRFTNEKIPNGYFLGLGHSEVVEPILHNGPDAWARKIHDQILVETSSTTGPPEKAATWVSAVT
jgi:hypothetical protein